MSNLPYDPNAGNGITNVNELYDYMYKYPLCVFDDNFMESYSTILAMSSVKTMVAYLECVRLVQLSGDLIISYEEMYEKVTDFMDYLKTCKGYGLHDTGDDPEVYERLSKNWTYSGQARDMTDTEQCHYFAAQCGCDLD
jgi:hypothetical protein